MIRRLIRRLAVVAASSATVSIDVSIQANLSVSVDSAESSTYAVTWLASAGNAKLVGPSTATVTNDSGGLTEKWALSTNAQSLTQGVGGTWSLSVSSSSVGSDQFAVQAVFGSSATAQGGCPTAGASDWDESFAPPLTASPVVYTSAVFADANLNAGGSGSLSLFNPDHTAGGSDGRMHAGSKRALCWRVVTPLTTGTVETQNIQITVTAVLP